MVSTSLMVDTIPVPPHPILLCALNYALTKIEHFDSIDVAGAVARQQFIRRISVRGEEK